MARIFSIRFLHRGVLQNALVHVRSNPFFTEYAVLMLDDGISDALPNNKIISTSKNSFVFSDSTKENDVSLMQEILSAVIEHLQMVNA